MKTLGLLALWAALAFPAPARLGAQSVSCTTGAGNGDSCATSGSAISVSVLATVMLETTTGTSIQMIPSGGAVTTSDLAAGAFDVSGNLDFTVRSNVSWTLKATPGALATCPSRNVLLGTASASRNTPLTGTTAIANGSAATSTNGTGVSIYFRVTGLSWAGTPMSTATGCALPATFTLQSP